MIEINNLSKKFKNETKIKYQNFKFETGKSYILLGASGCGKSTLLNMIVGILSPSTGNIYIDGVDMTALSQKEKDLFRIKKVGYIFQDFKLIEEMTVLDNINILNIEGIDTSKANDILKLLGIEDKKNSKIKNLSGGQKQRVAIARALVKEPEIIIGDEPTGNLNFEIGEKVCQELINASVGKTLIVVTHDDRLAKYFDYVINMDNITSREEELTIND